MQSKRGGNSSSSLPQQESESLHVPVVYSEDNFDPAFRLAIRNLDSKMLHGLKKINSDLFNTLQDQLNPETKKRCALLLELSDKLASELEDLMQQFCNGPGNLKLDGATLFFAYLQTKERYKNFFPVIFGIEDMGDFCKSFRDFAAVFHQTNNRPLRKNFIMADIHWIAGMIEIQQSGKTNIIILDSYGRIPEKENKNADEDLEKNDDADEYTAELFDTTYNQVEMFAETFADLDPSQVNIYVPDFFRIYAKKGCSIMSLRDIKKLEYIEEHLGQDIFSYCNSNVVKDNFYCSNNNKMFPIKFCKSAPGHLLSAQTLEVFDEVAARSLAEQKLTVNKKGDNATEALQKLFNASTNYRNISNEIKLRKWADEVGQFLLDFVIKNGSIPKKLMQLYTLPTLKNTYALEKKRLSAPPSVAACGLYTKAGKKRSEFPVATENDERNAESSFRKQKK
jgi:hypothetical protein